jgi:hypothetical protein
MFTEQDDIVPEYGQAPILNLYITNTLAGNDRITGSGVGNDGEGFDYGFKNVGILNTDDGNDTITGSLIYNRFGNGGYNIINFNTLNTGEGNDLIDGSNRNPASSALYSGIFNDGTLNTGGGDDTITGFGNENGFLNHGTLNTEDGNDIITFSGQNYGISLSALWDDPDLEAATLNTGEGNDVIIGIGSIGISNYGGAINTGNGQDSIISEGSFMNRGEVLLGHGNDSINAYSLDNYSTIETGDGNDIISSAIYNEDIINTGKGDDSIIGYNISNNGGAIITGDGNDSIIAHEGFGSGPNSSGSVFLGENEDYINGFGSGDFYGGNGFDTLELTPGTYTVGIWGEEGESLIFTRDNQLMITSQFERLIAGGTLYDFTSLTAGQIIVVV